MGLDVAGVDILRAERGPLVMEVNASPGLEGVVAAIERRAKEGDFRSNLHRGGVATIANITLQERDIALKAARTMGLDVAGVDILRAERGPLVMEVNASPGLEGVEKTTGIDIAARMIQWIERHATPEFCLKIGG
jgi:ribosomal protein S6--L-glutamate ligase